MLLFKKKEIINVQITFEKPFVVSLLKLEDEDQMLDLVREQIIELIKNYDYIKD